MVEPLWCSLVVGADINGQLGGFDIDNLVDLGGGRYTAGFFGPGGSGGRWSYPTARSNYI